MAHTNFARYVQTQHIARYILARLCAAKMRNIPCGIHKYSPLVCKNVMLPKIKFLFRRVGLLCEASAAVAACFATYSTFAGG